MNKKLAFFVAALAWTIPTTGHAKALAVNPTTAVRWILYYGDPQVRPPVTIGPLVAPESLLPTSTDFLNTPPATRFAAPQFLGLSVVHDFPDVFANYNELQAITSHEYPVARICDATNVEICLLQLGVAGLRWVNLTSSDACGGFDGQPASVTPPAGTDCIDSSMFAEMRSADGLPVGYLVGTTKVLAPTAIADQEFYLANVASNGDCAKGAPRIIIHNSAFFGGALNLGNWPSLRSTPEYIGIAKLLTRIVDNNVKAAKAQFVGAAGLPLLTQCSAPLPITVEKAVAQMSDDGDPATPQPLSYLVAFQLVQPSDGDLRKR